MNLNPPRLAVAQNRVGGGGGGGYPLFYQNPLRGPPEIVPLFSETPSWAFLGFRFVAPRKSQPRLPHPKLLLGDTEPNIPSGGLGFRVWGFRFRVMGLASGFGVQGIGFRALGLGSRVCGVTECGVFGAQSRAPMG